MPSDRERLAGSYGRLSDPANHFLIEGGPETIAWLIQKFVRSTAIGQREGSRG